MIRYTDADRTPLWMLESPRDLACCGQHESKAAGCSETNDAELPVIELCKSTNIGKVAQDKGEVMPFTKTPDLANAPGRVGIADVATKRVTRIGGIGDDAAIAQHRC